MRADGAAGNSGVIFYTADEITETLQFIADWLASDPARLTASLLAFVGHPGYGSDQLRQDLDRFTFLLGGSGSEELFGQASSRHPRSETSLSFDG